MGFVILPALVKKREMSLPLSAWRATASAEMGFFLVRVFIIAFGFGWSGFPEVRYPKSCLISSSFVTFK